jgi:two-component system, NtrC family, response regulator AtoC
VRREEVQRLKLNLRRGDDMEKILIIDDEVAICDSLEFALEDEYEVYSSQDPCKGLELLANINIDVVLLDLRIGNVEGLEVIRKIKKINEEVMIIMMTAYGSIESSVEAMKRGAFHYLTKPLNIDELKIFIKRGIEYKKLNDSLSNLKEVVGRENNINGVIGKSKELKNILHIVDKIKDIDSTVLITGESGTGKDVIAKTIHFQSNRKDQHYEVVNCAAIPNNLLESELFGYEKGAFTGALKKKLGKIELADKGTLFLDEIGEMDMQLQAKILRVVEDKQVIPLGGEKGKEIDVRVIAATNRDLKALVKEGKFREDLYFRLNVIALRIPPLRERKEDILLLIQFFLNKYNKRFNKNIRGISSEAMKVLESYEYPGNVRELENIVERSVALSDNDVINIDDLPEIMRDREESFKSGKLMIFEIGISIKDIEKEVIIKTLEHFNGNRKKTAEHLGISERNLQYKIKEYNDNI